jgi:hypothetical protein
MTLMLASAMLRASPPLVVIATSFPAMAQSLFVGGFTSPLADAMNSTPLPVVTESLLPPFRHQHYEVSLTGPARAHPAQEAIGEHPALHLARRRARETVHDPDAPRHVVLAEMIQQPGA